MVRGQDLSEGGGGLSFLVKGRVWSLWCCPLASYSSPLAAHISGGHFLEQRLCLDASKAEVFLGWSLGSAWRRLRCLRRLRSGHSQPSR